MVDIPHFRVPFQVVGGTTAVIEQDSDEDIITCVETILRTPEGSRPDHPDFGLPDQVFKSDPASIEAEVNEAIEQWEERVDALPEAQIEDLIATVKTGVRYG